MVKSKKILITGGAGFIGSHLAKRFSKNNDVWIVGRRKADSIPGVKFVKADVRKKNFLSFLQNNHFDYIFHLAGNADQGLALRDPKYDLEQNFFSTFQIIESLRQWHKDTKFIFASSVTVYGDCADSRLSEDSSVTLPISNYGASKLAAERYIYAYVKQYGIHAITCRVFSTYGPGLRRLMVYDFIKKMTVNPLQIEIFGNGTEARDLTFVDDQVENIIRVMDKAKYKGEVYNLGSGKLYTTRQVAEAVAAAMGLKPKFVFTKNARVFDAHSWLADTAKIKKMGARSVTTLSNGVKRTVAWFKENY